MDSDIKAFEILKELVKAVAGTPHWLRHTDLFGAALDVFDMPHDIPREDYDWDNEEWRELLK